MRRITLFTALALVVASASAQIDDHQQLATIFLGYRRWGRIDDELRWSPADCRLPPPSQARFSTDGSGRKIFFVYARDYYGYIATTLDDAPVEVGQVVIKEAFRPVEIEHETMPIRTAPDPHDAFSPATEDGHLYGPGEFMGLYVMRYTANGWTYDTIAANGEVTASGQIASCVGCHRNAPHRGLFGLD